MQRATRALGLCWVLVIVGCDDDHTPPPLKVDSGVPPVETLAFDPCASRNPVRVIDVVDTRGHNRAGVDEFTFSLPVGVPACVRLSNPAPVLDCGDDGRKVGVKRKGDHHGHTGSDDDDDDEDCDDRGHHHRDSGAGGGSGTGGSGTGGSGTGGSGTGGSGTGGSGTGDSGTGGSGTGGSGTGGGAGDSDNCKATRPFSADVALDQTAVVLAQRFDPSGEAVSKALELGPGQHTIRVRMRAASGSRLSIRVEVPGPVVDSLSPLSAEPGTRLSFTGEGYYGPLVVASGDAPLDNPTALSFATGFADTTALTMSGPLTVRTVFGTALTPPFSAKQPRPSLTQETVGTVQLTGVGDGISPVIIPEVRFLQLLKQAQPAPADARSSAAVLASAGARAESLGLIGSEGAGIITGDVFIVARDWKRGPTGEIETRDYYVVAARLGGYSEFATTARLAMSTEALSPAQCSVVGGGCQPLLGNEPLRYASSASAGLPADLSLNL
jgi:hypothetical protein